MRRVIADFSEDIIKTAFVEDGELTELTATDKNLKFIPGSIYVGKIKRILKSGFAFIDIGDEKNAFLYFTDKKESTFFKDGKPALMEGDDVVVQITREAVNNKGAAVSTALSLNGDYSVLMMGSGEIRISRKITDSALRMELSETAKSVGIKDHDIIIRTKAENADPHMVKTELEFLRRKLEEIREAGRYRKAPSALYSGDNEAMAAIKSFYRENDFEIVVNNECEYFRYIDTEKITKPKCLPPGTPLFREYFLEDKIRKALVPKVWLKSGGWINIETTEAMVVIDVNTGKFNLKNHEENVFKTNREAAVEIMKQLRLRNLSGIIIIDFVNMNNAEYKNEILEILNEKAKKDRISVSVAGMTNLGLVELTRKKVGLPIAQRLSKVCPNCMGFGRIF